jgi:predicted acylesterase/phospholipase RssA
MTYRILTFDGGGVRGAYTAMLLQRLSSGVPRFIDSVDLLAGTSTGGIIALGLASGRTPNELVSLYRDNAAKIFDSSWLHELADLHGVSGAEYDNSNLANISERALWLPKAGTIEQESAGTEFSARQSGS